jgi:hypothetical protein
MQSEILNIPTGMPLRALEREGVSKVKALADPALHLDLPLEAL